MAYKPTQPIQMSLNDNYLRQSERTKKVVNNSWAKDFNEIILPGINEDRFAVLYSDNKATRPNTSVRLTVGALIIKEFMDLSEDDLL